MAAPQSLQPIRNYLRFLGPATPNDVAAFLDSPVGEIKNHWPEDALAVSVDGRQGWVLGEIGDVDMIKNCCGCSVGSICSFKAKTETSIVPDRAKHKALWPILGRPVPCCSALRSLAAGARRRLARTSRYASTCGPACPGQPVGGWISKRSGWPHIAA